MTEKKFKVALVGCGVISKNHLNAISKLPNVELIALCDTKLDRAEERRDKFNLECRLYESYDELLESEELDAVHLCTPHYLHAPMTIAALKKNINVFLEKPTATTCEEIDAMLEAEQESEASVCICFQNRFNPSTILAKKLVEEDGGGKSGFACLFWERNQKYYTESDWRGRYATEGGGVMINQAIHSIDLLCEFLGKPLAITATTANHKHKGVIEVEDTCEGMIEFEGGTVANFYATTGSLGSDSTMIRILTKKNREIAIRAPYVYVNAKQVEDESLVSDFVGKECYGNGHLYLIRKFYEALENGTEMPVPLVNSQYAVRILLGAYRSHDKKVDL